MNEQIEVLITFVLYLAFFGWIGWMRGRWREGVTLAVALGSWILLQQFGGVFVSIANLAKKFFFLVKAGGLSSNSETQNAAIASLSGVTPLVTAESRPGFLFVLWVLILILAYVITSRLFGGKHNKQDGWAFFFGMLSGLLYVTVLLPRLIALVVPGDAAAVQAIRSSDALGVLGSTLTLVRQGLFNLWQVLKPQSSFVILIALTVLLVFAARSLRRGKSVRVHQRTTDTAVEIKER